MVWLHVGYGASYRSHKEASSKVEPRIKKHKILILYRSVRPVCCSVGQFVFPVLVCNTVTSHDLL